MGENIPNIGSRAEYKRYCTVHTWDKMLYKPVTGHPEKVTTVGPCRHRSKVPLKMVCAAVMAKDAARGTMWVQSTEGYMTLSMTLTILSQFIINIHLQFNVILNSIEPRESFDFDYHGIIVEFGWDNIHKSSNLKEQHVEDLTFYGHRILLYSSRANWPKSNMSRFQS